MKSIVHLLLVIDVLALATLIASASDPAPLQDFCFALDDPKSMVYVSGKFCKDPKKVTAKDFLYTGINTHRDTITIFGVNVTTVNVDVFPILNNKGVSLGHAKFGPYTLVRPHSHPRGSEMILVLEGKLLVSLVSSDSDGNRLFSRVLGAGEVFLFPQGLTHFALNLENKQALAVAAYGSQNPGFVSFSESLFGSDPEINIEVLAKAFLLDKKVVQTLQEKFKTV